MQKIWDIFKEKKEEIKLGSQFGGGWGISDIVKKEEEKDVFKPQIGLDIKPEITPIKPEEKGFAVKPEESENILSNLLATMEDYKRQINELESIGKERPFVEVELRNYRYAIGQYNKAVNKYNEIIKKPEITTKPKEKPKPLFQDEKMMELHKINFESFKLWFKELKESKDKIAFFKGEGQSPELKELRKQYKEKAPYMYEKSEQWISNVSMIAVGVGMAYQLVNAAVTSGFKVKDKVINAKELREVLARARAAYVPETGKFKTTLSDNDFAIMKQLNIFFKTSGRGTAAREMLEKIVEKTGGLSFPQQVNIFGTKLYAGLPADEIVKSLVKAGKVTANIARELSLAKPELVSQVIQNLSFASPVIASKLAPELVKLIPKTEPKELTKEEIYAEKYGIPLEKVKITEVPKEELKETIGEKEIKALEEAIGKKPERILEKPLTGKEKFLAKMEEIRAKKVEKPLLEEEVTVSLEEEGKVEALWAGEEVGGTEEITDPVDKLNELIKKAKPLRGRLETKYTEERAKRIKEVERVIDEVGGEEGYRIALSKLKGELVKPETKITFEPIKDKLSKPELDNLYNSTFKHPYLDEWEKISAASELTKLLQGELPTPKGLVLLEEIYGSSLIKSVLSKRALGLKITDVLIDLGNLPRAILATADMSAFLRQGIIPVISHPVISVKAMKKTFQFAFSPKAFDQYFKDLRKDKLYPLIRKSGLSITDPSGLASEREEAFISRSLQKTPIIGDVVKFAERAYVGFLNKVRVDLFKTFADELLSKGFSPVKDINLFKATADVVNTFTGRGSMGTLNRITPQLNIIFFSPRLITARFNALNPIWYAKMPKEIRMKAIGDFSKFVVFGLTLLALIKASGLGDVETNPRSSDFGKIRIGNTRWDIWGGFQQWVRVFAQVVTGQRKNTATGEIISLTKDEYPFTTRKEVALRFIEGKLAPVPALVNELISGAKTFEGEDISLRTVAREKFIPMYIQDITEAYMDGGLGRSVGAGLPAFFGVGVQTWQERKKKKQLAEIWKTLEAKKTKKSDIWATFE